MAFTFAKQRQKATGGAATLKVMKGGVKMPSGSAKNEGFASKMPTKPAIQPSARTEAAGPAQTHKHDGNINREPAPANSPALAAPGKRGQGGADGGAGGQGGPVHEYSKAAEKRPLQISNAQKKGLKATTKRIKASPVR